MTASKISGRGKLIETILFWSLLSQTLYNSLVNITWKNQNKNSLFVTLPGEALQYGKFSFWVQPVQEKTKHRHETQGCVVRGLAAIEGAGCPYS